MIFFWILILSGWVGLIILILHDATKEDSDGGAIRVTLKAFGTAIDGAMRKIQRLREGLHPTIPLKTASVVGDALSSSDPIQQTFLAEQVHAAARKLKSWRKDGPVTCTIAELELKITEAVRKAAPECEPFLGVILQKTIPRSRGDANWQIQGVKFGTADRKIASEALTTIIERMQRNFSITER